MMRAAFAMLAILVSGCASTDTVNLDDYENSIIVELTVAPAVTPDNLKHDREDCPTGGWIGDGTVRTRCLDCEPAYSQEEAQAEPAVVPFPARKTIASVAMSDARAMLTSDSGQLSEGHSPLGANESFADDSDSDSGAVCSAGSPPKKLVRERKPVRRFLRLLRR